MKTLLVLALCGQWSFSSAVRDPAKPAAAAVVLPAASSAAASAAQVAALTTQVSLLDYRIGALETKLGELVKPAEPVKPVVPAAPVTWSPDVAPEGWEYRIKANDGVAYTGRVKTTVVNWVNHVNSLSAAPRAVPQAVTSYSACAGGTCQPGYGYIQAGYSYQPSYGAPAFQGYR